MKAYVILDESGAMHMKNERYFIIAGYICSDLQKIKMIHKDTEKIVKERKKIPLKENAELKAAKINTSQQALFINELYNTSDVFPVAIIIDKYNLKTFEATENMAYNYFVNRLMAYLFNCNIPLINNSKQIEFRIDNRSISLKGYKDLQTYLQWEYDKEINVFYLDSRSNREIQMADYVANMLWKSYNRSETEDLTRRIKKNNNIYKSIFPLKTFGKNPTLRDMEKI